RGRRAVEPDRFGNPRPPRPAPGRQRAPLRGTRARAASGPRQGVAIDAPAPKPSDARNLMTVRGAVSHRPSGALLADGPRSVPGEKSPRTSAANPRAQAPPGDPGA